MNEEQLAALTDEGLLVESKKFRMSPIVTAAFIGFMVGIIFFSVVKSAWGAFTLIPLFLAFKAVKDSKKNVALEKTRPPEIVPGNYIPIPDILA